MIIHSTTSNKQAGASRSSLRRGIQIALTSGLLVSGFAGAALRDHGPSDPVVAFPDWYRDANGLALGQCVVGDDAGNGPLCLLAGADPTRFAGNFGEEGFYATADVVIPLTGGNFHWMGHLEMAYATADGAPPAVRDPANPQEVVFSRERMLFDVPTGCGGHYTIRTPFKVHEFDLEPGRRALFYTDDILPVAGDYNAALKGHTGPFLIWDGPQPAVSVAQPVGPARNYVGDPNVPHTFVGSTLPAGPGHEDKGFNNYVEVIPPTTCDLGAGAGVPMFEENGSISGLVWDLPIADPVVITKTAFSHNATTSSLNVWATGPANKKLILTAASDTSQQLPSMQLKEEVKNGTHTGQYFGHLEFSPTTNNVRRTRPAQVTVTNLDSVPTFNTTRAVDDAVVITKAIYNPANTTLCVAAHSGDEDIVNAATISLEAPAFGAFTAPTATCSAVAANDMVLEKNLSTFLAPDFRFPPEGIVVKSSKGGTESVQPLILASGSDSDAATRAWAVNDTFAIDGTGVTTLDLTANDAATIPANRRIVIVGQPEIGSVVAGDTGGSVAFNAIEGMPTGPQTFYYAIQNTTNGIVGNVGKVTLNVTQVIPAPVAVADAQGVFRTCVSAGTTNVCPEIKVLANDVTGLTATPIDPASVELQPLTGYTLSANKKSLTGARGTVSVLANGSLRYVPTGQGTTANNTLLTVQYTVANTSGNGRRSVPVNVNIVLKSAAEAVAFQRARFAGGWDVRFTSTYAGAAGTVTLAPTATCRLYTNTTAYANGTGTALGIIGSAFPGAGTNAYVVTGATPTTAGLGNTWVVGCVTSSGGRGQRTGTL